MRITLEREKFMAAFQTAASVAPVRSPKPILHNVKFEAAVDSQTLMATDLETGIRIDLTGVEVQTPGTTVLPIAQFGQILRESRDERLSLESDPQSTLVKGEHSEFRLGSENPDEFPNVGQFTEEKYSQLPARLFRELIRRTLFATDSESSRYALGGVLLEITDSEITAVGTDGRRLAKMVGPVQSVGGHQTADRTTIVPMKAMQLMERALGDVEGDVQIAARANDILVRGGSTTVYSRLTEGRFPRWRDVFPQRTGAARIELNVGQFSSAVRQAAIVTSEESRGVDFKFAAGKVELSGRGAQVGHSHVEQTISYDGDPLAICLDPRYMIDFLKVLDADRTFTLEIENADRAAVCSTDDGYGYVIMPLARER
ncbi:MAG: DNA polymerase III subunit beta [Planctomycetota bacterium]|nr:DNA polymerase III subunit beta [Planctomycetota bacterium]